MSELKLLPCPFCGSEADLDWGGATDIGGALHQNGWVCCTNPDCDATVDVDSINDSKSDIDLINKWNQRAETETEKRLTADMKNAISLMSPSWQHAASKEHDLITRYVTMAESQFKKKNEEIERLTAISTKNAARSDELYEALDNLLELIDSCEGLAGINRSQYIIDPNELSAVVEAKETLDKSRIEAEKGDGICN